jgi:hypothetical protein
MVPLSTKESVILAEIAILELAELIGILRQLVLIAHPGTGGVDTHGSHHQGQSSQHGAEFHHHFLYFFHCVFLLNILVFEALYAP